MSPQKTPTASKKTKIDYKGKKFEANADQARAMLAINQELNNSKSTAILDFLDFMQFGEASIALQNRTNVITKQKLTKEQLIDRLAKSELKMEALQIAGVGQNESIKRLAKTIAIYRDQNDLRDRSGGLGKSKSVTQQLRVRFAMDILNDLMSGGKNPSINEWQKAIDKRKKAIEENGTQEEITALNKIYSKNKRGEDFDFTVDRLSNYRNPRKK